MKLYHCRNARSLRPLWTLEELGLDYELELLPFPPRRKCREYLEINPLGTVPCFIDKGLMMTESAAICQYLVDTHAADSPLGVARDDDDYGRYLNWLQRSDATLTFPQTIFLRYSILEVEEHRHAAVAESYKNWFLARAKSIETDLSDGRSYLCAGRFTIVDICVGYALYLARAIGITEVMSPPILSYWEKLSTREAFQRADAFGLQLD